MVETLDVNAGLRLRRTREFRGLGQRDLARRLGLGVDGLDRLERGAASLEGAILLAAAVALGVEPSFFFRRLKGVDGARRIAMLDWGETHHASLNDNTHGIRKPRSNPELTIVDAEAPPELCP